VKLLSDTHLLLWAAGTPDRLPGVARVLIEDPQHELIFSSASLWEIGIGDGTTRRFGPGDVSSLTTSQAGAIQHARWEFRGSVPLCR
jgi:PIN domain nuclease of toxin-antitoxin system